MTPLTFFFCAAFATTSIISVGAMKRIEEITVEDSKSAAGHGSSSSDAQDFSDANSAAFFNGLVGILTRLKEKEDGATLRWWKRAIMELDTEGTLEGYVELSKVIVDLYHNIKHLSLLPVKDTGLLEDRVRKSLGQHLHNSVYNQKYKMTPILALPLAKLINSGTSSEVMSAESLAKDVVTVLTKNNVVYKEIHSVFPDTKRIFRTET